MREKNQTVHVGTQRPSTRSISAHVQRRIFVFESVVIGQAVDGRDGRLRNHEVRSRGEHAQVVLESTDGRLIQALFLRIAKRAPRVAMAPAAPTTAPQASHQPLRLQLSPQPSR